MVYSSGHVWHPRSWMDPYSALNCYEKKKPASLNSASYEIHMIICLCCFSISSDCKQLWKIVSEMPTTMVMPEVDLRSIRDLKTKKLANVAHPFLNAAKGSLLKELKNSEHQSPQEFVFLFYYLPSKRICLSKWLWWHMELLSMAVVVDVLAFESLIWQSFLICK